MARAKKFSVGANFKASLTKQNMIGNLVAAVVPVYSAVMPSLVKQNGVIGALIAYVPPIVGGMALNNQAMVHAGVAQLSGHLVYEYGDESIGIWSLNDGRGVNDRIPTTPSQMVSVDGRRVMLTPDSGMHDYVNAGQPLHFGKRNQIGDYVERGRPLLNDYINKGEPLAITANRVEVENTYPEGMN